MGNNGQLPVIVLAGIASFFFIPAFMTAVREVILSSIDPQMPLSGLITIMVGVAFNPISGFVAVIGGGVLWLKSNM